MPDAPGTTAPQSKRAVFLRRSASFVALWSLLVAALFFPHQTTADAAFLVVMILLAGVGLWEFYGMAEQRGLACFKRLGVFGAILLVTASFFFLSAESARTAFPAAINDFELAFLVLFVLGLCVRQFLSRRNAAGMIAISVTLFGLMYVPWLLNFVQKIHFFPEVNGERVRGNWYVLYFILVTKFSDAGAYVTGSLIGRHKMIPRISPNKTWEGFAGAILISTGASVLFAYFAGDRLFGMNLAHAVVLGVLLSGAAVVGDLIESIFKREAGVKDSGRIFPGMGGMLDLLDSLLFNAPLMYLYLRYAIV
jgi:phosphatidate cytidylyltransferase